MIPDKFPDMVTFAGHPVWYDHPSAIVIDLQDIKEASKNICRYGGHKNWRLIQHHALCGKLAINYLFPYGYVEESNSFKDPDLYVDNYKKVRIRAALIHDFSEVWTNDVVSGLKKYLPAYKIIEDAIANHIFKHFGLDAEDKKLQSFIHFIDRKALILEMIHLDHHGLKRFLPSDLEIDDIEQQSLDSIKHASLDDCWNIIEEILKMTEVKNG